MCECRSPGSRCPTGSRWCRRCRRRSLRTAPRTAMARIPTSQRLAALAWRTPSPQTAGQSVSTALVPPGGQQPSPESLRRDLIVEADRLAGPDRHQQRHHAGIGDRAFAGVGQAPGEPAANRGVAGLAELDDAVAAARRAVQVGREGRARRTAAVVGVGRHRGDRHVFADERAAAPLATSACRRHRRRRWPTGRRPDRRARSRCRRSRRDRRDRCRSEGSTTRSRRSGDAGARVDAADGAAAGERDVRRRTSSGAMVNPERLAGGDSVAACAVAVDVHAHLFAALAGSSALSVVGKMIGAPPCRRVAMTIFRRRR